MVHFIMLTTMACYFVIPMAQANVCPSNTLSPPQYQFYPNVTSRSSFLQCLENSGTYLNVSYTCPDGLVFRARTSRDDLSPLCASSLGQYGLATFDCSRNKNGNGSYSGDNTLYVTCKDGVPQDLYECPLGEYLDAASLICKQSCTVSRKVGIFPTADDGYYTCMYDYQQRMWVMTSYSCGAYEKYNSDYHFCLLNPPLTTPAPSTDVVPTGTPAGDGTITTAGDGTITTAGDGTITSAGDGTSTTPSKATTPFPFPVPFGKNANHRTTSPI